MGYKIGILGGMGPLATTILYQKIIEKTKADCDQDHIEMVILNKCSIPDRTKALLEGGKDPIPKINEGILELISLGCQRFIIPCNTAHCFKSRFKHLDKIHFIDMIEETKKTLGKLKEPIMVLCTNGTKDCDIYGTQMDVIYPDSYSQWQIMEVITKTKSGNDMYQLLKDVIIKCDYNQILLACTELSVYYKQLKKDSDLNKIEIYDALDILASQSILECGYKLK